MNSAAQRIVRRYFHGDAFINLTPIPVVLADGGVVSASDLECVLKNHGIDARDVVIYRHDGDAPNVFRWEGHDGAGHLVMGRLVVRLAWSHERVVVSAAIELASLAVEAR